VELACEDIHCRKLLKKELRGQGDLGIFWREKQRSEFEALKMDEKSKDELRYDLEKGLPLENIVRNAHLKKIKFYIFESGQVKIFWEKEGSSGE
jgi:hypothetical protein